MTYDGSTLSGYINGILFQQSSLGNGAVGVSSSPLYVGSSLGGGTGQFDGQLNAVRIYVSALSESDVQARRRRCMCLSEA